MGWQDILGDISPILSAVSPLLPADLAPVVAGISGAAKIATVVGGSSPRSPPSPAPAPAAPQGGPAPVSFVDQGLQWLDKNLQLGQGGVGPYGTAGRIYPSMTDTAEHYNAFIARGAALGGTPARHRVAFAATAGVNARGVPGYFCPGGYHVTYKSKYAPGEPMCVKNRRMNPFNPRALSRAARRLSMFSRHARHYMQLATHKSYRMKPATSIARRRRKKCCK
jgi:hypothetical protein